MKKKPAHTQAGRNGAAKTSQSSNSRPAGKGRKANILKRDLKALQGLRRKRQANRKLYATLTSPRASSQDGRLFTPRKEVRKAGYTFDAAAVEQARSLYSRRDALLAEARQLAANGQHSAALELAQSLREAEKTLNHHDEPHEAAFTRAEHLLLDLAKPEPAARMAAPTEAAPNWGALDISKCLTKDQQAAAIKFAGMRGVSVAGFVADSTLTRLADLQNSITLNERAHIMATVLYRQRALLIERVRTLANGTEDDLEFAKELSDALRLAEELLVSHGETVDTARTPCQAVAHSLASM